MASKVTAAARQGYPAPQPTHSHRNILLAIFFGAIGYFYAHQWACDGLREATNGAWREYQTEKNRCTDARKIYQIYHDTSCTLYNAQVYPVWDAPFCRDYRINDEAIDKIPESQGVLKDAALRAKQACDRALQAKEKHDYREGWRNTLVCNPF